MEAASDIIDLNWFEKEIQLIKNAKWDGVAFCLKSKKFTPMLIEFFGGFDFNTTQKKENNDEGKLVKAIKDILKYTDALGAQKYPMPQYYVRFFGNYSTHYSQRQLFTKQKILNCRATNFL